MVNTKVPDSKAKTHHVRSFFAAVCGTLAIWLIAASVLVVWLDQTLLNNAVFASTVAPLVSSHQVQSYVVTAVSQQLENANPPDQMAQTLFTGGQTSGQDEAQITAMVDSTIQSSVMAVVQSPTFATQWKSVTGSAHDQFVSQLNSNTKTLSINLRPALLDVIGDLKQTKLAPLVGQLTPPANAGQVSLAGTGLNRVHTGVRIVKTATLAIGVTALVFLVLAIWLSVHHVKTVKRILWSTGAGELAAALVLSLIYVVKLNHGSAQQQTAIAITQVLLRNLRLATAIVGIVCIAAATILHYTVREPKKEKTPAPAAVPAAADAA